MERGKYFIDWKLQWLGLIYPEGSIYVDSLRECYEAYVIYNFMMYLLAYLNADHQLEHRLEISPQVHHVFPLCCLPDWEMGREFVHMCKHGILQYAVVRPLSTLISLWVKQSKCSSKNILSNHWMNVFFYKKFDNIYFF